jgi:hypothetical protein
MLPRTSKPIPITTIAISKGVADGMNVQRAWRFAPPETKLTIGCSAIDALA